MSADHDHLDHLDLHILTVLQENCKLPLVKIGERVGLSAPSVIERIRKLEENGVIRGYTAILDGRKLGKDITAFIGVSIDHPALISTFETAIDGLEDIQECHHVTGEYTLLLKVKAYTTSDLEELIRQIRSLDGVQRTETSVVLSTHTEGLRLALQQDGQAPGLQQPKGNGAPSRLRRGA